MRARIAQIHPQCRVHAVDAFVEPGNWPQLLPQPVDALIDACDRVAAKLAMAQWAREHKMRFITVGAAGGKRAGERVERRAGGTPAGARPLGVPCVFSREAVVQPAACDAPAATDGSLNCHGYGSSVAVTATFGLCAAGWALDQLAKAP